MTPDISNYRKFINYSQTDMAELLGISLQAYWAKENGKTPFTDKEKIVIKNKLIPYFENITIDDLFFNNKCQKVD